jgi:hypothetical protein
MPKDAIVIDVSVCAYNPAEATGRVVECVADKVNAGVGCRFMSRGTGFWYRGWSRDIVGIVLKKCFKVL